MSTIVVGTIPIPDFRFAVTEVSLRIYLHKSFVTSSGIPLQSGKVDSQDWYLEVPCTISGTNVSIASFTIDSTTDGANVQTARYGAYFYSNNRQLCVFDGYSNFAIGPSPSTITWGDIADYQPSRNQNLDNSSYPKDVSDRRYALASVVLNAAQLNVNNTFLGDNVFSGEVTVDGESLNDLVADAARRDAENTFTQNNTFTDALLLQSIGGGDPLLPPNLVGAQTVKFGSSAIINDSGSGDYRQISAHVINSGTRNIVAGSFGARADGAGNAWGINPWGYANASGATGIAIENNFAVLASGGHAFGEVFVVVGNFDADAFLRFQTGVSGINTVNGIEVNRGAIGYEPISGSFLTFLGSPTMATGFDFSGGIFTTAPFLLGNNQFVKAKNTSGTGKIAGGCDGFDYMLFQSPGAGVRFINSANTAEIFKVKDEGILELTQITAPSGSPSAGTFWIFMDVADGKLKAKGALGTLTSLANP